MRTYFLAPAHRSLSNLVCTACFYFTILYNIAMVMCGQLFRIYNFADVVEAHGVAFDCKDAADLLFNPFALFFEDVFDSLLYYLVE